MQRDLGERTSIEFWVRMVVKHAPRPKLMLIAMQTILENTIIIVKKGGGQKVLFGTHHAVPYFDRHSRFQIR